MQNKIFTYSIVGLLGDRRNVGRDNFLLSGDAVLLLLLVLHVNVRAGIELRQDSFHLALLYDPWMRFSLLLEKMDRTSGLTWTLCKICKGELTTFEWDDHELLTPLFSDLNCLVFHLFICIAVSLIASTLYHLCYLDRIQSIQDV